MIRYRSNLTQLKYALRDEHTFETMDDLLQYIYERWGRVVTFMGAADPFRPEEILISDVQGDDPVLGYRNVRRVCVTRMTDQCYKTPQCIGFCGE